MISKRILIAEDEPSQREILVTLAKRKGYDVTVVTDGVDLLKASSNESFDLIVTDLNMPDLNGASAAEIMKMQGHSIPVIALTALSPKELQLVQNTFTKIFYKPCNYNELFGYIESLLKQ